MVGGFITKAGGSGFAFVPETINADRYIQLLRDSLLTFLDDMPLDFLHRAVFQQDNAPAHRSRATMLFLTANGIRTTLWPALSPNLKILEIVWAVLKQQVRLRHPQTLSELRRTISYLSPRVVTRQLCERLFSTLPSRMDRVIADRGLRFF